MQLDLIGDVIDELDAYRSANGLPLSDLQKLKRQLEALAREFDREITRKQLIKRTGTDEVSE